VNNVKRQLLRIVYCAVILFNLMSQNVSAQIVTNGSFENSDIGIVNASGIEGWLFQVADTISSKPVFEIVNDTVKQGNRALKISINGTGASQWDIQAISDSIPAIQGTTYYYSVWAKAEKSGAKVNFTVGNYSYSEYGAVRPATLTTQWQKFTIEFTVSDNQAFIRAPIHFSYSTNAGNEIFIDALQIVDENFGKTPVVVEAESGAVGSNFLIKQSGNVAYVTPAANYTGSTSPGDTSRMITYNVTFQDSGYYNLFARVQVGSGAYNDDSFFSGNGFGAKNDTASADWVFVNGLASAGFSDSNSFVEDVGTIGSEVWKWVNVTKNYFSGDSREKTFYVSPDSLTRTFQIGSREDGLLVDKFAFGKSDLFYKVKYLDNDLPGVTEMEGADSSLFWTGPPIADGDEKFLGNAYGDIVDNVFKNYWNQLTPGNAGKWGSVASSQDTTKWNWSGLDWAYNYAVNNNMIFKYHTLIWGAQQPSWISGLDSTQQAKYIETWIRMVGQRYPKIDFVDVVNEPLAGHNPPDGGNDRANYKNALGGNGQTGYDWVIKSFELARKYLPDAKLLLNDYGIINDNNATTSYLKIINLLKDRGLIDGIGVQGHRFEFESTDISTLNNNLNKLAATGLPIYISEFDLGNLNDSGTPNDNTQLNLYKKIFPVVWKHKGVKGITLWGYLENQMWQTTCYLVHANGKARPALEWLAQYIKDNPTGVEEEENILPSSFELGQNYPNPFNPTTKINYSIVQTSEVKLTVYDILGREVRILVNNVQSPGLYTVTFNANDLASGVYFYRLKAGNFYATKKLMLIK
jgi:endo-1,4-beta-xylanase